MSERSEKQQLSRSERPIVTPQPTRLSLFEWIENKFDGRSEFPRFFELKLGIGRGGTQYLADTIHQKEFKPNQKKPERDEMVEIGNQFVAIAQEQCNQNGRAQMYLILALNHMKGAAPYAIYSMKLQPQIAGMEALNAEGGYADDGGILSDGQHRDALLRHSLEHQKANDMHAQFMSDGLQRSVGSVLQLQQEIIRELRQENQALKGQQLDWYKAVQESYNTQLDRDIRAQREKVKNALIERGAGLLMQMVPVVAKTLEARKTNGALPAASQVPEPILPSPESIAIHEFVQNLAEPQKIALFGHVTTEGKFVPDGIFTLDQVNVFASVGECKAPSSALEQLLPGGEHEITSTQIAKAQEVVPMDQLMPLYAMIVESQKNREAQQATPQPQPTQQEMRQ